MAHDRRTRKARYGTQPANQESKVWHTTGGPGKQGMARDRPNRRASYWMRPADQESQVLDVGGRAEARATTCAAARAGRPMQALTSAGMHVDIGPDDEDTGQRSHSSLATIHSSPGIDTEPHARLVCLAGSCP